MAKAYIKHLLVGLDQLANAVIGGWPDESISSRAYRNRKLGGWKLAYRSINKVFFWQADHCHGAYVAETQRRHQLR